MAGPAASDRGHLAAPTKAHALRQRSVLARLIATVEPVRAEQLARDLLAEFRTVGRIYAQSREALARVDGMNRQVIDLLTRARDTLCESLRGEIALQPVDPCSPELRLYLTNSIGSVPDEVLRVLFLDQAHRLIADEEMARGTIGQITIHPRVIFRRALEHDASAIILAHNHPSGDPRPSAEDIRATQFLEHIGRSLGITLVDHLVVTASRVHHIVKADYARPAPTVLTLRSSPPAPASDEQVLANIRRLLRRQALRHQLLGSPELFGDPAWEMIIDVLAHECEGKDISISSLCVTARLPMSTSLRLAQRLCNAGILRRTRDHRDGRRSLMRLDPAISHRLRAYFSELSD